MIRRALELVVCRTMRIFFRRLQVTGKEHVPDQGPVLFVLNHPNALVDPMVLLCQAGRRVSFLAKEPLFRMPVLGTLIRAMDAIPVYRRQDNADLTQNRKTFEVARRVLGGGGSIGIFPEGRSHTEPQLMPLRTGAARIALGAVDAGGLDIVPAGLFYTDKMTFRSAALLCFGPPIRVVPVPLGPDGEPPVQQVRVLTDRLEVALGALTVQADHHEALRLVEAAEAILISASDEPRRDLDARRVLRQRLTHGYASLRTKAPDRLARVQSRITRYVEVLHQAELTPELLPKDGYRAGTVVRATAKALVTVLLLLPLALVGLLVHAPAWVLIDLIGNAYRSTHPDLVATMKVLGGVVFFPLTWLAIGVGSSLWRGWHVGLAVGLVLPIAGYAALRFLERLDRLLGGARGVLLALTGRRHFLRLVAERKAIREELLAIGAEYGV